MDNDQRESYALFKPNNAMHRLHIPVEVIFSLAVGADEPYNVLTAYGFSDAMAEVILNDPAIQKAVQAKQQELQQNGHNFRLKARMGAEMLLDQLLVDALGEKVPLSVRHDIFKTFSKLGELEPKEEKNAVAPTGFTVNITLGGKTLSIGGEKPAVSLDIPAENDITDVFYDAAGHPEIDLPNPPKHLKMPSLTPIFGDFDGE